MKSLFDANVAQLFSLENTNFSQCRCLAYRLSMTIFGRDLGSI